jgi:hypothetical protein
VEVAVRRVLATTGIPRNWVLDANAAWRFDEVRDREGADNLVADAERMIEETRAVQGTAQQKETVAGR